MEKRHLQKRAALPSLWFPRHWALTSLWEPLLAQKRELVVIHLCPFELGGRWCWYRQLVPAVNVGLCVKMIPAARMWTNEWGSLVWSLCIKRVVSNRGVQDSVFVDLSWYCPGFHPRDSSDCGDMLYILVVMWLGDVPGEPTRKTLDSSCIRHCASKT